MKEKQPLFIEYYVPGTVLGPLQIFLLYAVLKLCDMLFTFPFYSREQIDFIDEEMRDPK